MRLDLLPPTLSLPLVRVIGNDSMMTSLVAQVLRTAAIVEQRGGENSALEVFDGYPSVVVCLQAVQFDVSSGGLKLTRRVTELLQHSQSDRTSFVIGVPVESREAVGLVLNAGAAGYIVESQLEPESLLGMFRRVMPEIEPNPHAHLVRTPSHQYLQHVRP